MSKEYIEALDNLFGLVSFQKSLTREQFTRAQEYSDIIEQALQRLESIDNAKPSKALEYINTLIKENDNDIKNQNTKVLGIGMQAKFDIYLNYKSFMLSIIKQALIKAQEQEKVLDDAIKLTCERGDKLDYYEIILEIIKKKNVDTYILKMCKTVDEYNSKIVHIIGKTKELTQEEFDLLKES